ncbi:hypothetical protein MRX96_021200 [Rhipicephalus microplus]
MSPTEPRGRLPCSSVATELGNFCRGTHKQTGNDGKRSVIVLAATPGSRRFTRRHDPSAAHLPSTARGNAPSAQPWTRANDAAHRDTRVEPEGCSDGGGSDSARSILHALAL